MNRVRTFWYGGVEAFTSEGNGVFLLGDSRALSVLSVRRDRKGPAVDTVALAHSGGAQVARPDRHYENTRLKDSCTSLAKPGPTDTGTRNGRRTALLVITERPLSIATHKRQEGRGGRDTRVLRHKRIAHHTVTLSQGDEQGCSGSNASFGTSTNWYTRRCPSTFWRMPRW